MTKEQQIVSRKRVADHGEVYTAEREVKAMCDLAGDTIADIGSRVLEPACGNGNFLEEILRRKMRTVASLNLSDDGFDCRAAEALSSIYGIDILEDNVAACRERLLAVWKEEYAAVRKRLSFAMEDLGKFLLERNVVQGNALTMTTDGEKPIVFSEWAFNNDLVSRTDYDMQKQLKAEKSKPKTKGGMSLLDACKVSMKEPEPILRCPPVHFRSLYHDADRS